MAKKVSENNILSITEDWGLDSSNNLPYSGAAVQKFIKDTLNAKMGCLYYDTSSNRYLIFADEIKRDQYLENPTASDLILGTFDAPFNYEASITLLSESYVSVPIGTTGNIIEFTFDTVNKNGDSVGEDVICTYTIVRGSTSKKITQRYRAGQVVTFNIDNYLLEGTNRITVGIVGQTTLAATTVGITYQVVNLTLSDDIDISKVYDTTNGDQTMEVPFTVTGTGTKIVEWYLNGSLLEFEKNVDEVVDSSSSRIKYIKLTGLQRGINALEFRAYSIVDGEKFYSKTIHRDVIVENKDLQLSTSIIAIAYEKQNIDDTQLSLQQYITYPLRFAIYNPANPIFTQVNIFVDETMVSQLNVENGIENVYSLLTTQTGNKEIKIVAQDTKYIIDSYVHETDMNISEITAGLELDFSAVGRNNNASGKETWTGNGHTASLIGFTYTPTSGWVNDKLLIAENNAINFDYAPLASESTNTGKTIEFEFASSHVSDDNAVLCDLRNNNGVGILITASEASIASRGGAKLSVKYKPEENTRISFVINRATGTTNKGLVFIYVDGVVSAATNFGESDDFKSDKLLSFKATADSEILLKQVRVHNNVLTTEQILNNYIIYRDTTEEMLRIYNRNDVLEEDSPSFSIDKLQGQLPVMLVTGDIPILENTTNKDTQIIVDIEYYNLQDTSKSFTIKNAAMRPQGTSSMLYPKKNYRFYTQKVADTELYDWNGRLITDKLYSFKEGAQPVDCWCLKADYAESSGTHNTGIARLWNEILYNSALNGEYVFRTQAQKAALESGYPYDVRTTIDGFPILLFYRHTTESEPIFIGKYNFNNDKSTESVFGFTGIPNFDNSHMQCWEILNNGDALALFTDVHDFDTRWADAYESRYPDTKTPNTADLKAFSVWLNGINGNKEAFATEKWNHMNVYMMAAYYVYLMRFGAVDQVVKNAMLTSEDGVHFYFINYDNDTINGLRNNGVLVFDPTIDRQSLDPETGGLAYAYAGHDSVLWNMLEDDAEFMQIVKDVDNVLYTNGLSYDRVIQVFNEQQADQWNESIYNQDAQYKYISPYTDSSLNNLEMLQGKRQSHRKWWLSRRFSLYDSKFVSGDFKGKSLEFKVINNTEPGWTFSIEAGTDMEYGYGVYNPIETGINLQKGETHNFTINQTLNIGDPVRIYSAVNLQGVDLSNILPRLSNIELNNVYNDALGTKLKKIVLGNGIDENTVLSGISSLSKAKRLEYLDIRGCKGITTLDLSQNIYFKKLYADNSGLTMLSLPKGGAVNYVQLPNTLQVVQLEQLIELKPSGLFIADNAKNVRSFNIIGCPELSKDINIILNWLDGKITLDTDCSLYVDNIDWTNVEPDSFLKICTAKKNGANITLKGTIKLTTSSQEIIDSISEAFGSNVFKKGGELFVNAPDAIYLTGPSEILEGESAQFTAAVFTENYGTVVYSIVESYAYGAKIDANTGYLTSVENLQSYQNNITLTIRAMHRPTAGSSVYVDKTLKITRRVYPSSVTINGNIRLENELETYTWSSSTAGITGDYRVEWELTGDILEYAMIESTYDDKCVIRKLHDSVEEINGTLTVKIIKNVNNSIVAQYSKTVLCINPDILMTKTSNPEVMACMWKAGLCANEDYMTKTEAAQINDVDIQSGTSQTTSIFYNGKIKTFDEFEYFTSLSCVPSYCFAFMNTLTSVKLPKQITSIKNYAFPQTKIKSIEIPDGVLEIGDSAFFNIQTLSEINIPSSVTTLGGSVFRSCTSLKRIYGGSGVTKIDKETFLGCGQINYIDEKATFGIYTHKYGYYMYTINNAYYTFIHGTYNIQIQSSYKIYFDGMATNSDITLGYTGSVEDLTERLKIRYIEVEFYSNLNTEFVITYQSSFGGEKTTVKSIGKHLMDIDLTFNEIKIKQASSLDGYNIVEENHKVTPSNKTIFIQVEEDVTIGIAHKNGNFYTSEQWIAEQHPANDAEGVCILTNKSNHSFIIAKENASENTHPWHDNYGIVQILNNYSEMTQDFSGIENTKKFIEKYTNDNYAASVCSNYVFPSGFKGYLPALGELIVAQQNKNTVESIMNIINGSIPAAPNEYWSSTEVSNNSAWSIGWNNFNLNHNNSKSNDRNVIAFSAYVLTIKSNINTSFIISFTNNNDEQVTKQVKIGDNTVNIKVGTQITVTPNAIGNLVAEPQTFTWTGFRHECSFAFAMDAGVYIQHVNGSLYTESEWTAGGYANSDANGVALLSETAPAFVIAKADASSSKLRWGGYGKTVPDIVTTDTRSVAVLDFDGASNTTKIINFLAGTNDGYVDGAPAAEACANYTFPSGQKGYLPTAGEWKAAYDNKSAVVSAMSLIGGTAIRGSNYWSSTQYNNNVCWSQAWFNGNLNNSGKHDAYTDVRAFSAV